MNEGQLEIKLSELNESQNDAGRWQHYTFTAYEDALPIAQVDVDRVKEIKNPQLSTDPFFMDFDFDPPRPRPYLFFMGTEEVYRGRGIAGRLIEFANEFFKKQFGTPLHSGITNSESASRVWEKLVEANKATEYENKKSRRWAMH